MVMKLGVLALQGAFIEHIEMLRKCGAEAVEVRTPEDLKGVKGLILPGGESTAIGKLLVSSGLGKEIIKKHKEGMGVFGTCAGAILLSKKIINNSQTSLNLLDIEIKRNEYGRQVDSFEADLAIKGIGKFKGIFIRSPIIHSVGKNVEVLAEFEGNPVMVRQGKILACAFHPELTEKPDVHKYFIKML